MIIPLRVLYTNVNRNARELGLMPYLPLTLERQGISLAASALLDTGAAINVLPYPLGLALGGDVG